MSEKKRTFALFVFSIVFFALSACSTQAEKVFGPGEDLLGSWQMTGDFFQDGVDTHLLFQINEIQPEPEGENSYLAVGCMQTETAGS